VARLSTSGAVQPRGSGRAVLSVMLLAIAACGLLPACDRSERTDLEPSLPGPDSATVTGERRAGRVPPPPVPGPGEVSPIPMADLPVRQSKSTVTKAGLPGYVHPPVVVTESGSILAVVVVRHDDYRWYRLTGDAAGPLTEDPPWDPDDSARPRPPEIDGWPRNITPWERRVSPWTRMRAIAEDGTHLRARRLPGAEERYRTRAESEFQDLQVGLFLPSTDEPSGYRLAWDTLVRDALAMPSQLGSPRLTADGRFWAAVRSADRFRTAEVLVGDARSGDILWTTGEFPAHAFWIVPMVSRDADTVVAWAASRASVRFLSAEGELHIYRSLKGTVDRKGDRAYFWVQEPPGEEYTMVAFDMCVASRYGVPTGGPGRASGDPSGRRSPSRLPAATWPSRPQRSSSSTTAQRPKNRPDAASLVPIHGGDCTVATNHR